MRRTLGYCLLVLIIIVSLTACSSRELSSNKDNSVQEEFTGESAETKKSNEIEEQPVDNTEAIMLSPEEQYDNVFAYFSARNYEGKSRHSFITEAEYYVWANEQENQIQFMYYSNDKSQGVLLTLNRNGDFGILVNIKTGNEDVIGTAGMNAADYTYGYEFEDFTYQSDQRNWDYEKFKLRANAYVRDTMLYADSILQDYLGIGLYDLGFSSWKNPGSYKDGYILSEDIAGLWEYKSNDEKTCSSTLYLKGDKIYWHGDDETYADALIPAETTEEEEYLLSQDMMMSVTDPYTGEVVIVDEYIGNDNNTHEQFRRYIYHNADGNLCMRVESVYLGMSNQEDGKIYVKVNDDKDVSISPEIYYPSKTDKTDDDQPDEPEKPKEEESASISENSIYQSILDEYTSKMEKAVPGLIEEYKSEAAGVSDINRLAEICNDKVGELAEICNEGISEMAEIMYLKGDSYDTYEEWAGKLMDNYTDFATEIQNVYIESVAY